MNTRILVAGRTERVFAAILLYLLSGFVCDCAADSTINPAATSRNTYGANFGWIDWRANVTNGVVVGEFVLSGNAYGANVGWIDFGDGGPANGIWYSNTSAGDYGVNNLGDGRLSGFAYGANIGWIAFTNNTASGPLPNSQEPRLDLVTGALSGFVYSANCGWISLDNLYATLVTDYLEPGSDSDGDSIPDAWEHLFTTNLTTLTSSGDFDHDGVSDRNEYLADTDPLDINDQLRITAYSINSGGTTSTITWTSRPTRLYTVAGSPDLPAGSWSNSVPPGLIVPDATAQTTREVPESGTGTNRFYRVQAMPPLVP